MEYTATIGLRVDFYDGSVGYFSDPEDFAHLSNRDKKMILEIAFRDQGTDRVHKDCGFALSPVFITLLEQSKQCGDYWKELDNELIAALPHHYVLQIVADYCKGDEDDA